MKRPGRMLGEVLRAALRKPATVLYPSVKFPMPEHFRGQLRFIPERCIGCKLCMRDCPTAAIEIFKVADKQFRCEVDLARCIYCSQCVDSCPRKALEATDQFELAQLQRQKLVMKRGPEAANTNASASEPSKTELAKPEQTSADKPAKG
jgi:formate hydrogenlyase subunit 6/NADH:ubiquinone oxidoreductase subunit I